MDATPQTTLEILAEKGLIPPIAKQSGPRGRESYRAFRRNHVKTAGGLDMWRQFTASYANDKAGIQARRVVANGAREAAAKAMADAAVKFPGLRRDVVIASAMLDFYRGQARTRPVNRIIRQIEQQVRS